MSTKRIISLLLAVIMLMGFGIFQIWPDVLMGIFGSSGDDSAAALVKMGVNAMRIVSIHFPIAAVGIALGAIAGFLMGILCQHSPNLHRGYTLYNAAAVAGFIGVLLFAFMYRGTGHEIPTNTDIGESYALLGNLFAVITSLLAVVCGFFMNGKSFRGMGEVLKSTGYKCDFTKNDGVGKTLINIGLFGLFVTGYYNLTGAAMTGPTVGCIVCLLAITPCGAHIFNMFPIMLGYLLANIVFGTFSSLIGGNFVAPLNSQSIIVGLCYANGLSPIADKYGWKQGVIAAFLHYLLVTSVPNLHGGFCLYNGGFTAALICLILVPELERFFKTKEERKETKLTKKQ